MPLPELLVLLVLLVLLLLLLLLLLLDSPPPPPPLTVAHHADVEGAVEVGAAEAAPLDEAIEQSDGGYGCQQRASP